MELEKTNLENLKQGTRTNGKKYSVRDNRDRFFFPKEWFKFYDKLNKNQKFTFSCLINTGARINEIRNVRVQDVDFENKRLILRVTKIKSKAGHKNPRPRIIPLSTQFTKYLKKHIRDKKLENDSYLGILSTPAANISLKKKLQEAGIKDWYMFSVHNIRKTLEVWLMALGVDGLKLTAHIGHSMSVAARNYLSADVLSFEEKSQIRIIIGDLYQNRV